MDAFQSDAMRAFRRKARDYFRGEAAAAPGGLSARAEMARRDLDASAATRTAPRPAGLSEPALRALAIDEAAGHHPRLGLALLLGWAASDKAEGPEAGLFRAAHLTGTSAYIFETTGRAAREGGYFASSLMGFRDVQEGLADLMSGVEALRVGACRVCFLLERGERERAEAETSLLERRARELLEGARSLAVRLLGEAWLEDNVPRDPAMGEAERSRP